MKQGMLSLFLSLFALNAFTAEEESWTESLRQWDYYLGAGLGWANHDRFSVENSVETFQFGTAGFTTTITQSVTGDYEPDAKAWRVVGGAWFHEHFGVEFGYLDLGKTTINQSIETITETQPMFGSPLVFLAPPPGTVSTQSNIASSVEVTGISMLAKARHPIIENVDLILSLGAIRWDIDERRNISETLQATGPVSVFFPPPSTTSTSESIDIDGFDLAYGIGLRTRVSESLQLGFEWTRYEASEFDSHVDLVGVNAEYHFDFSSSTSTVLSKYSSATTPILGALKTLWPFNSSAPKMPQWEYFIGISGGIAEHNWVGDQDDEDVSVTDEALFTETIVSSVDEDATAWKASVGAYVSKYFGFELAYADFGRTSARSTTMTQIIQPAITFGSFTLIPRSVSESGSSFRTDAEISSYSLNGIARLPVTPRLEFGAKLGATLWDVDGKTIVETSGFPGVLIPRGTGMTPSITVENSGSGVDINYGASIKFRAYKKLWVGFDYSRYEVGDFDEDVDYLALSFEYRFGTLR